MKYRPLLIAIVLVAWAASASGQKITKDTMLSEGKKRTYYLYVPAITKPDTPTPLVILLHGSNHVGLSLAEKWKDLAAAEGFIIVAPDSIDSAFWGIPADGPRFMRDLVEEMKGKYSIDPRRVYLFGHSGGAGFALLMGLYESQYFAAIAIHAGALNIAGVELIKIAKRKTPFHIQVGNMDPLYPVAVVRETRNALKAAEFPVELKEIPNHGHYYYDLAPNINQAAWNFLKTNALSEEPRFEDHTFARPSKLARDGNAAAAQYNRALKLLQERDYAGAVTAFSKAIESDPGNPDAFNNRGVAYTNQKNYEAALADFTRSLELGPSAAAYSNRAGIYFDQKKIEAALADFSEAVKLKPSAETYSNRGLALTQSGKEAEGLADFDRAIQLDPKFGRTYILRGLLALNHGQSEAAQKDFDTGFQLEPALHAEFDSLISQIKTVRGIK
jgi:tetratricopeptide (TPR) repeat protein